MRLSMVGAGYVGLVSSVCFSELGHQVTCIDIDAEKIQKLSKGLSPIYEPGLEDLLVQNLKKKRLKFTSDWAEAIPQSDIVFIAVSTPTSRRGNGYADLTYVYEAAKLLAPYLHEEAVVVNKSTVPVGTAKRVGDIIREVSPKARFHMASNPEFLREGSAIQDFMKPDRIILGASSSIAKEKLLEAYDSFQRDLIPIVVTTPEAAELVKYAANAFLAMKLSFINEMSHLSEALGVDIQEISKGIGLDHRIGPEFLKAGPGFGGSCLPKDTLALIRMAQEHGSPCRLVETVIEVNHAQKGRMIKKIREGLGGEERGKTLAVLGLTFKADTDDMREAPSLTILPPLIERGLHVKAHDPQGIEEAKKYLEKVEYCDDPYLACEEADALCLMTDWNIYPQLDWNKIKKLLKTPTIIDLRNVYDPAKMKEKGFRYIGVGRGVVS